MDSTQFLKGLSVAIIGLFVFWLFYFGTHIEFPINIRYWISTEENLHMGLSIIGLLIMCVGPIYFWIIEPTLKKRKVKFRERGLRVGVLFFMLFLIAGFAAIQDSVGWVGDENFDLNVAMQEVPLWIILTVIGFFGMFIGPIYYWIVEPILQQKKQGVELEIENYS